MPKTENRTRTIPLEDLMGFIDSVAFKLKHNTQIDYSEKIAAYKTLISLQEFIKIQLDRQIREGEKDVP